MLAAAEQARFLFALTRDRVTDAAAGVAQTILGFYSLLREIGSLTGTIEEVIYAIEFLFALTRDRVTDSRAGSARRPTCFYSLLREIGSLTSCSKTPRR